MDESVDELDALMISAGAALSSAKNQAALKAFAAAGFFNRLTGNADGQAWTARHRAAIERERAEEALIYERLRRSHPYIAAVGEALPAAFLGLRGLGQQIQFNLGRAALEQSAQGTESPLLLRLSRGLRTY